MERPVLEAVGRVTAAAVAMLVRTGDFYGGALA